jgi:UDP-N-acetylglucosamine:LPS N-acetylglucosamine transferase
MKIAMVCNEGGHLTEAQLLSEAFDGHETVYLTYDTLRGRQLDERKYLFRKIGFNPLVMVLVVLQLIPVLLRERPDAVVTTGGEIAIPALVLAKLFGVETIYVESWCRIRTRSGSGRLLYHVADLFLVQWPQLTDVYGEKARYEGALI